VPREDIVPILLKYKGLSDREVLLLTAERVDSLTTRLNEHLHEHEAGRNRFYVAITTALAALIASLMNFLLGT